ncbi:hypothetical protein ACLOAV_010725 [Pseudogymnoascus australis]
MDTSFEDFSKMLALIRLTLLNVGRLTSLWAKMQFEQLENGLYIGDLQAETQASEIQTHITPCKPGIWASSYRHSSQLGTSNNIGRDAIVRWVADGELNLNGPAENWKSEQHGLLRQYEQFDANHFTWRRHGNLWVDGGMANILSMAYLKPLTASSIQGWDLFPEVPDFNKEIEVYFSILARGGSWFVTGDSSREGYTIGGMSWKKSNS